MLELTKTYDRSGESELTVVFLHGIAASSKSFAGLLEYLSGKEDLRRLRFVAYDWLGAGESYTSDELEYNYAEQLEALGNSVKRLGDGPLVVVAHSMGTLIAVRFAEICERVKGLVLVSPPVYRKEDIENPAFEKAMAGFREVVGRKADGILESKVFNNEISNIVSNKENYEHLLKVKQPTVLVYGELDQIIAPFNIPKVLKANGKIRAVKTAGSHGVAHDKYAKIARVLKDFSGEKEVK